MDDVNGGEINSVLKLEYVGFCLLLDIELEKLSLALA